MGIFSKTKQKKEKETETVETAVVSKTPVSEFNGSDGAEVKLFSGVLVQPRVSEKAGQLAKLNKYVFLVEFGANKISVKKAVEKTYKVKVIRINVINMRSRERMFGRIKGKTSGFRKAIVTLKQGDRIEGIVETA
ncbi:MAG: 50S ribosomal protein L23 [Candidatus Doudnabacteria bacterium CG10_big_fil_rev_8_21_14_0_10_42_18]|uniref:Large ribosomal subunit protein uL23 n=1 Tax=Candidatus Doudnabacteria bacterium CG10_big_fil_rev_8_21_14_0_10_42_18 TaxID=1974552 RepID=A0A2H0VBE9_9BACT|nr:MAG: 50S ribosomal protein L23 [Candidatus Doudnabacteria bacterium CG10_big_fil_rev_8_21_14_0_10_42_18]